MSRPSTVSSNSEGKGVSTSRPYSSAGHASVENNDSAAIAVKKNYIDPAIKLYKVPENEKVYDIDEEDTDRYTQCTEYVNEVYEYYKELEVYFIFLHFKLIFY